MRQTCALAYDDNLTVVASSSRWSVSDHLLLPLHQPRFWWNTENRYKQLTRSNPEVAKKLADDLQKEVDARYAFYDAMSKDTEGLISL